MKSNTFPEPIVGAFIRNKQKQVLLARSPKWENGQVWIVAGGHIELGETIKDATEREVLEELGIKVEFLRVFNVLESINDPRFSRPKHFVFLQCECLIKPNQQIKIDNTEIIEAKWFDLSSALEQNLLTQTRASIEQLHREEVAKK